MLDGRIDTQGTVEELRDQGLLDHITHDASLTQKDCEPAQSDSGLLTPENASVLCHGEESPGEGKKPRKLVKDEHREAGGVKWEVYKSYLKAS